MNYKDKIHQEVLKQYSDWYGDEHGASGSCLYWMQVGLIVLTKHGFNAVPQAGSMNWPILADKDDDGIVATHFTYEWSPWRDESRVAMLHGYLPEIHCWIGLPDTQELVDFSTKHFHAAAMRETLKWTAPLPPDYLWTDPLGIGAMYQPEKDALCFLYRYIMEKNKHAKVYSVWDRVRAVEQCIA
mgnify:CR=1 FL=1